MRLALNCPTCGASIAANLPDTVLPAGWLIHQAVTCGRCGHLLQFEDGGAPDERRLPDQDSNPPSSRK